jgi:hypothetical protein
MNPHPIVPALLLISCSSFAACGSDDARRGPDRQGPLPEDQFLPALSAAVCDGMERCCREAGVPHDPDACRQAMEGPYYGPEYRDRFEYDPVAAGECVALARRTAETCLQPYGKVCWEVYKGVTQPGEACSHPDECAVPPGGRAACEIFGNATTSRCRSQPRGAAGDRCNRDCTESFGAIGCGGTTLYSDPVVADCYLADDLYCLGTCRPLLPLGSACGVYDRCERGAQCGCEGATPCETPRCLPKLADGARCENDDNCRDDLYCNLDSLACQKKKPAGAPCDDFRFGECEISCGHDSDGRPVCVEPPPFPPKLCTPEPS